MKYNDNGTYKDIYVKAFDTLPIGAIVEYSGSTIPSGWTNIGNNQIQKTSQYIEGGASLSNVYGTSNENGYTQEYINSKTSDITTGNFTLNSNVSSGYIQYVKIGKFIQVQTNFILNSSAIPSGTWKTITLGTVPSGLEPKIQTNILARRDEGGQMYILNIETTGEITIKDRGTGNLQAGESIVCNGFYIIGD